ncbi:hypothetical protein WR25_08093 [Diploscapter pachys]|uniref:Uncharacterized protein n=1 Tax=Diploscapter pachys TaxID=2018661 RepID=A0A2A2KIW2_9BILA|nr:hypothetical protein WR25_08093 [Diploscapter pachys]
MATSNSALDKDDFTEGWFTAAGDKAPVTAQVSLGYNGSVDSDIRLAPVTLKEDDGNVLDFSGLQLQLRGDRDGKAVEIHGNAEHLELNFVDEQQAPVKILLNGFKAGGKLHETAHDMVYVGNFDLALADTQEQAKVQADLQRLLVAKPQVAVEKLAFKTANGESHFNLAMDFASPSSFDLPPDQLGKQLRWSPT